MRIVNERVSQWACGRYFFYWEGDEFLLEGVTTDDEAIAAGAKLQEELENE